MSSIGQPSSVGQPTAPRRLDSWKEIAAFLGRAERTVKRWESERGMPVHRVPGSERGAVFAYDAELLEWLKGSPTGEEGDEPSRRVPKQDESESSLFSSLQPSNRPDEKISWLRGFGLARLAAWAVPLILLGTVVALTFGHRSVTFGKAAAGAHEPNPEARDLYLQGRYYWNRRTPADLNRAVDSFTQAIVKDPSYAPAYIGLADCYNLLREFGAMPAKEAFPRALAAAQRAVALDPSSAEAHTSLAFVTFYWVWDGVAAEQDFKRALELDPKFARAHHWYATSLAALARFPEALDQLEQARALDPSSTALLADKGWILYLSGKTDDAVTLLSRVETIEPSLSSTHGYLAAIAYNGGDYNTFTRERKIFANLRNDEAAMAIAQSAESGLASGGDQGMLEKMLETEKLYLQRDAVSAFDVAETSARLGRKEDALRYLQQSYNHRDIQLLAYRSDVTFNTTFAPLRGDPRFARIIAGVGQRLPN
jgi:Tfp pilus assembly protein PilF